MKPKSVEKVLLDADVVAYRAAFSTNKPEYTEEDTRDVVDGLVNSIIERCNLHWYDNNQFKGYLTGKDNFRFEVAKTHPYKGNRKDVPKPGFLPAARQYLIDKWGCVVIHGSEADDAIATEMTNSDKETTIMVSVDKDFKTIPGWLFNFVKNTWQYNTEWDSLMYFYSQILSGDDADNIKGLYRIGEKTAYKLLTDCETEKNLYEVCLKAYEDKGETKERLVENARLLHLRRFEGEVWRPPE